MSHLRVFSNTRDPQLFQKIPCHLVALLKDNAIFNVLFQFETILLCVSFTYQRLVCMYSTILLYIVFELNKKVFLKQAKPFAAFALLFAPLVCRGPWVSTVVLYCGATVTVHQFFCILHFSSMLAHIQQIFHHMH